MSDGKEHYPGPFYGNPHPSGDDAIYATRALEGTPQGYTTGAINTVNPHGNNVYAINAAFAGNVDPVTAQYADPNYQPPPALVTACADYVAWHKSHAGGGAKKQHGQKS